MRPVVLENATNIQCGERELQDDKRVRPDMEAPRHPQSVAQKKCPKPMFALSAVLVSDQPNRYHGDEHGRPLQELQKLAQELNPVKVSEIASLRAAGWTCGSADLATGRYQKARKSMVTDIAIMPRFSVSEIKPSGTLESPPTQAHFNSRLSI